MLGDYRTQFHAKAQTLSEALTSGQYDFGFLHIKAVDDTGHDQQPVLKVIPSPSVACHSLHIAVHLMLSVPASSCCNVMIIRHPDVMVKVCVCEDLVAVAQVQYLECVDVMIKQLIQRLHQAEAGGQGHYCVCVTGDHSTPVLFGDHSHEPVPFTVAHVRHVVSPLLTLSCLCQLVVNNNMFTIVDMPLI